MITVKNEEFHLMIQRKKDDWELGGYIYPDRLIEYDVVRYNNLVKQDL